MPTSNGAIAAAQGARVQPPTTKPNDSTNNNNQLNPNHNHQYLYSSTVFQQVKQTQASLARLTRAQQQLSASTSQTNQSSQLQQQPTSKPTTQQATAATQQTIKSTTFVDCLIRRFKDCFNKDCFTVPMFVVGSLSPGSDGTHLILPPCVSLGGQNISRFASPKNLRLMNSIRESCRSIEELDLGGNKLNDLIEVYKILQCTPNLKFLNLSENDLSRSSPVAMAATYASPAANTSNHSGLSLTSNSVAQTNNCPSNGIDLSGRTCLGPLNQNPQHQRAICSRRHSSLGQSAAVGGHPTTRAAEVRRLAATNAVAQSKKTSSSSVANLLTQSSRSNLLQKTGRRSLMHPPGGCEPNQLDEAKLVASKSSGRLSQMPAASTMHMARSLSSLSSKDIRASSSSLNQRISNQRQITRRLPATLKEPIIQCRQQHTPASSQQTRTIVSKTNQSSEPQTTGNQKWQPSSLVSSSSRKQSSRTSSSNKLFNESIEETEDVDMNQMQQVDNNQPETNQKRTVSTVVNNIKTSSFQIGFNQSPAKQQQSISTNSSTNYNSNNYRRTFRSIKALALNNTGCQWRVVCSILSRMPNLEELHLSLNNYERIDLDPNEFTHSSLKRLYLCSNPKLNNWNELDKLLLAFPSLEALSIADCSISQIPENLDRASGWRKLCGLNINGWPIKEWPVIERLNQLPSLIDLRCRDLDVLNNIDEPRHHLIARLPKLQRLNGSEIEEREHAEKAFLRFFMANSNLERPPRFHELIQIHGDVSPVDVDVDLSPPNQASVKVIYLNKSYYRKENDEDIFMSEEFLTKIMDNTEPTSGNAIMEASQPGNNTDNMDTFNDIEKPVRLFKDESQEVVAIDIDLRQSVRKFKTTIASFFGLESRDVILYYIDHEMVGLMGPELIKHNQKKLWNYNVQNGDHFIVEER